MHQERLQEAVRLVAQRCPRLAKNTYWAGTSAIALEELHHRRSLDLDFHTRTALQDVRPFLAELKQAFSGQLRVVQAPDALGSGFRAVVNYPDGFSFTIEVLANFDDVEDKQLVPSATAPGLARVSLVKYAADKVQCIAERVEARDLADIAAILRGRPEMERLVKTALLRQDAVVVAERLLAWSDAQLAADLSAYSDIDPADAAAARDQLLAWLKEYR